MGKEGRYPRAYFFNPTNKNNDPNGITNMSMKIRLLQNVMWQSKFGLKMDRIENLFSKRSLSI
jgi:hypothetical protein